MQDEQTIEDLKESDSVPGAWLLISHEHAAGFSQLFDMPVELAKLIKPYSVEMSIGQAIQLNQKMIDAGHDVEIRLTLDDYLARRDYPAMIQLYNQSRLKGSQH